MAPTPPSHHLETQLRHRINAGRQAVLEQVRFFKDQFACVASEWKEDDTRVTFADFAISEKIGKELRKHFSEDDFFSEEGAPADEPLPLTSRFAWVLDPIDGTNNYALGIPLCGISLGLLKDGAPIYGFIYDFSRDCLVEGGQGKGLLVDQKPAIIKRREFCPQSLIALHFPMPKERLQTLQPLMSCYRVRSMGSSALNLSYLAQGILDGVIDERVKIWDIAAGVALLQGAGIELTFMSPPPFPMQAFETAAPDLAFIAGSAAFMAEARKCFDN